MPQVLFDVRNLKKHFPVVSGVLRRQVGTIKAVDGISFTVHPGEVLGVVGESGCGKSTAARAAIRLIEPTEGEVTFRGSNLLSLPPRQFQEVRKEIQIVFQDPYSSLNPRKKIGETIGEALLYHKIVKDEEEKKERAVETLEKIGLSPDVMERYPHEFSGGQQQRICIGRAIAMRPCLLVCDEAVSALDVSVQAQILNLLNELKESMGLSYLFISHDLSVIRHICNRVVVMYFGQVVETASVDDLFTRPKHPYTQALLSATPKNHPKEKKERKIFRGSPPSFHNPPKGCPFQGRCPHAQPECANPPPKKVLRSQKIGGWNQEYFCILE